MLWEIWLSGNSAHRSLDDDHTGKHCRFAIEVSSVLPVLLSSMGIRDGEVPQKC